MLKNLDYTAAVSALTGPSSCTRCVNASSSSEEPPSLRTSAHTKTPTLRLGQDFVVPGVNASSKKTAPQEVVPGVSATSSKKTASPVRIPKKKATIDPMRIAGTQKKSRCIAPRGRKTLGENDEDYKEQDDDNNKEDNNDSRSGADKDVIGGFVITSCKKSHLVEQKKDDEEQKGDDGEEKNNHNNQEGTIFDSSTDNEDNNDKDNRAQDGHADALTSNRDVTEDAPAV